MIFFNRQPVDEDIQRWEKSFYVGASAQEKSGSRTPPANGQSGQRPGPGSSWRCPGPVAPPRFPRRCLALALSSGEDPAQAVELENGHYVWLPYKPGTVRLRHMARVRTRDTAFFTFHFSFRLPDHGRAF